MVRKLLKYEWASFIKTLMPMELILLGMAVLTRFVQLFEDDTAAYQVVSVSSIVAFCVACVVCLVMTVVVNIARFYRNLYTAEGYLSFTLPVTADQHLFAKLFTAVVSSVLAVVSVLLSIAIATSGEVFGEIFKAVCYLLNKAIAQIHWQTLLVALEILIFLLVYAAEKYLLFYACATLGQTAKKRRVLASFGYYFIYYAITQVVGTVVVVIATVVSVTDWFERAAEWAYRAVVEHPFVCLHTVAWVCILLVAVLATVFYLINRWIMKHKLNLE